MTTRTPEATAAKRYKPSPTVIAPPLVPWTHDIAEFNGRAPGELQFFRYEVEFDLDATNEGVTRDTTPVHLDFLKIPFVF